jgi:hypothetical protein
MAVCDRSLTKARERVNEAYTVYAEHEAALYRASAEAARLEFLRFCSEHPEVDSMCFEAEWQYDDEASYYKSVSCYCNDDEINEGYEFYEAMNHWGSEALAVLCGLPADALSGELTLQEARERSF